MDVIIGNPGNLVFPISKLRTLADVLFQAEPGEAEAGPLNGFKIRPFVNDVTPTKDKVLADYTAPATAGLSTAATPTIGAAFESDDGTAIKVATPAQFVASAVPAEPETVYGIVMTDAAGTGLLAAERFETPQVVSASGQGFTYLLQYALPRM